MIGTTDSDLRENITPADARRGYRGPLVFLSLCLCVLLATVVGVELMVVANMRDSALRGAQSGLANITVALAEQANRAFDGVDMVLSHLAETVAAQATADGDTLAQALASEEMQGKLSEKLTGLAYLDAISLVGPSGRLINFSSFWPPPEVNLADRDYFRAMVADPELTRFVSAPVRNRATGQWTLYLARRVQAPGGVFAGLAVASVSLPYFEDFYRSVSMGEDRTIALSRRDGLVLASFPPGRAVGEIDPAIVSLVADAETATPDLIHAWRDLPDYPVVVAASQTTEVALREWRDMAWLVGLISMGSVCWVVIAAFAIGRWWRQQQELIRERAERAELERERLAAEAELARGRERNAEEASRAKSGFLATMSHEIRTPMNGVLGLAGTLLDEPLAPQHRKVVEAIRDSGDALLRILNDILDFSKLDAGRMTFEDVAFAPTTLTHGIVSILGPRARAKGLSIAVVCDAGIPPGPLGDAGRIRQVLLNLVSNAVKFTETGSIDIAARLIGHGDDTATLEWVVKDTGIGIPADRIDALFGEFIQVDSSISRRFGGSGMGLAISKRLIEQMGGAVTVRSELGKGASFHVRLTLPVVDKVDADEPADVDVTGAFVTHLSTMGRPLRVLFAEDNPTNQFVAMQILKGFNVQVDVAADGLEAVDAATTFLYDVICMDMQMPEMDGLSATRLLRRRGGRLAEIPVIALTANAFPEDVKACLDAGMNLFVAKPVRKETLLAAMLSALGAAIPNAAAPSRGAAAACLTDADEDTTPDHLGPDHVALDHVALAELASAIGEDGVAEMFRTFETETRHRVDRLSDPARDRSSDERDAHTLKGAASTVCAPRLAGLAEVLEQRLHDGGAVTQADIDSLREAFGTWRLAAKARHRPEIASAA